MINDNFSTFLQTVSTDYNFTEHSVAAVVSLGRLFYSSNQLVRPSRLHSATNVTSLHSVYIHTAAPHDVCEYSLSFNSGDSWRDGRIRFGGERVENGLSGRVVARGDPRCSVSEQIELTAGARRAALLETG